MATTQSNLGKVHVFPSETLYNNNKTNVAANDLAFVVDNSSGIVAQSLGTNGYVKFANGFLIQWGWVECTKRGVVAVTFPITFKSAFNGICCTNSISTSFGSNSGQTSDVVNTGMNVVIEPIGGFWIAIGIG